MNNNFKTFTEIWNNGSILPILMFCSDEELVAQKNSINNVGLVERREC